MGHQTKTSGTVMAYWSDNTYSSITDAYALKESQFRITYVGGTSDMSYIKSSKSPSAITLQVFESHTHYHTLQMSIL